MAIRDLKIEISASQTTVGPPGYTRIPADLNAGAGGYYIYLNYQEFFPAEPSSDCITGLWAVALDSAVGDNDWRIPPGYYPVDKADVNAGAGGKYVYICYTKNPELEPVTAIDIVVSDHYGIDPEGWNVVLVDLNQGAGGKYIWLRYRRG
jgi:hypothetical protein